MRPQPGPNQFLFDENRFGAFAIHTDRLGMAGIREILSRVVIVEARTDFASYRIVYGGYCPDFNPTDVHTARIREPDYQWYMDAGGIIRSRPYSPNEEMRHTSDLIYFDSRIQNDEPWLTPSDEIK